MSTEATTRWTALTALATSALAVGISIWSVGCEGQASAQPKKDSTEAAAPVKPAARANAAPQTPAQTKAKSSNPSAQKAPAASAKKDAQDEAAPDVDLRVKRLVVTHTIEEREPVAMDTLTTDEAVTAFVEVANGGSDDGAVVITFERAGQAPVGHIKLKVPGNKARWRTWGRSRRVTTAGEWDAVVSTADGTELARKTFTVEASKTSAAKDVNSEKSVTKDPAATDSEKSDSEKSDTKEPAATDSVKADSAETAKSVSKKSDTAQ